MVKWAHDCSLSLISDNRVTRFLAQNLNSYALNPLIGPKKAQNSLNYQKTQWNKLKLAKY